MTIKRQNKDAPLEMPPSGERIKQQRLHKRNEKTKEMKKQLPIIGFVATALCLNNYAYGDKQTVNGIEWNYTVSNGKASLRWTTIPTSTYGAITVPATLGGCPVVCVGSSAFYNCTKLTSVTLPDSVDTIESGAFYNCTRLTKVTMPDGIVNIGDRAFYGCCNLSQLTIPRGVANIPSQTFYGCSSITSLTIPSSVTNIDYEAFRDCRGISSLTILDGVRSLGEGVFRGCTSIEAITIPSTVSNIGVYLFYGCTSIKSVTIENNVIGSGEFSECSGLTTIAIPGTVAAIGSDAFYNCANLTSVTLQEGTTCIGDNAFYGCNNLSSINIPQSISQIGALAFVNCKLGSGIVIVDNCVLNGYDTTADIVIPDGTRLICAKAFTAYGQKSISLPKSIVYIGHSAFTSSTIESINIDGGNPYFSSVDGALYDKNKKTLIACPGGLTSFAIRDGVTSIGDYAFDDCYHLTSISIPDSVTDIGAYAFNGCSALPVIELPINLKAIGNYSFEYCRALTSMTIPSRVESIGDYAFCYCTKMNALSIPACVTHIGYAAFIGCSNLKSVTIPNGVKDISHSLFYACAGLTSVMIPKGVTNISCWAFRKCTGLKDITIPSTVKCIDQYAFWSCSSLTNITLLGDAPTTVYQWSFQDVASGCHATVYQGTTGWDDDGDGKWAGLKLVYREREQSPIPDLGDNPSAQQIAQALEGSTDTKLSENITDGATYEQYRDWASKVKAKGGSSAVGADAVKNAQNAWLSFALGSETLIETAPSDGDLKVDNFEPATESGKFDFTVSVKDIDVGSDAAADNLKKVFGLEGGTTLAPGGLSSDNVNITFGTPENGKVKFTAGPKNTSEGTFFMKVKMTP